MEGSVIDLSKYRLAQAQEALSDSQKLFDAFKRQCVGTAEKSRSIGC